MHTIPRTGDEAGNQRGIQKRYEKLTMCSDLPEPPSVPGEAPIRGQLTGNRLPLGFYTLVEAGMLRLRRVPEQRMEQRLEGESALGGPAFNGYSDRDPPSEGVNS